MWAYNNKSGFTIVELLIVIVVIAILAAITIVAYNGIQERAVRTTMMSDLRQSSTSFEMTRTETSTYPATMVAGAKTSNDIVLQATNTGSNETFSDIFDIESEFSDLSKSNDLFKNISKDSLETDE